jgi:hypothetical protein
MPLPMSYQDNVISIDLGKQGKNDKLTKLADDFGNFDLASASQKNTGDELLDFMDEFD